MVAAGKGFGETQCVVVIRILEKDLRDPGSNSLTKLTDEHGLLTLPSSAVSMGGVVVLKKL